VPHCEITGDGLFYSEEGKAPLCLISFWDYYANLGALPLHTYNYDTERILPRVLYELQEGCTEPACMPAVSAVFKQSLLGYRPLRVLMTGGGDTLMAVLERAAHEAHPESRVYMLAGDGDFIRGGYFDLAVIGGETSEETMRNVLKAMRTGGSVVNVAEGYFQERRVSEEDHAGGLGLEDEMRGLRAKLMRIMGDAPEQLRAVIAVLSEMEVLAVKMFDISDIDMKQRINEAKENALNALYSPDEAFRAAKLEKLRAFLK
jgi:hypothetical protein